MEKQEKKEKRILTENRMVTVNKRETSFEGLVSQFENGEDGVYGLITNNKNTIFQPKVSITKKDLEEIPDLVQVREAINYWENLQKKATGKEAYIIKKAIIELRKEQYQIKEAFRKPVTCRNATRSPAPLPSLDGATFMGKNGYCDSIGVELVNSQVCFLVLSYYDELRQFCNGHFDSDTWYLLEDFDLAYHAALDKEPLYARIVELKRQGLRSTEIQQVIEEEFGLHYSIEHLSNLWRNKIPALIASAAEDRYLNWYYLNIERGKYKRCSKCGKIKLAHNKYFSKNSTSKDGFYSVCKECRSTKRKKEPICR